MFGLRIIMTLILSCFLFSSIAEAKRYHHRGHVTSHRQVQSQNYEIPDMYSPGSPSGFFHTQTQGYSEGTGGIIGGRPAGCPHAYCGCGASIYKFGRIIPGLNLAWEWARRFPRISMADAGPGDAAVRAHHVAIIIANKGSGVFTLHDSNSGGGRTRIHDRLLAGYVFVRPHG